MHQYDPQSGKYLNEQGYDEDGYLVRPDPFNYYSQSRNNSSMSSKSSSGLLFIILILGAGVIIEKYGNIILAIVITGALIGIVCFIYRIRKNTSSGKTTSVFVGRDSKNRPVFENKDSNGNSFLCKLVETGEVEMYLSDFEADKGTTRFKAPENMRRYYAALEKGLVQAVNEKGDFEKNEDGFIRYKDRYGNYVDNPYDYLGFTGNGKETSPDGDIYEGDFVNGLWHGKGKVTTTDGFVYEGYLVDGNPEGIGKGTLSNGNVYEGNHVKGNWHGKGKFTQVNDFVYEGDFENGHFNGKGKMIFKNGNVYEGDFVDDKRQGKGKFTWFNGDVYEGDFVDDKRQGKGKSIWSSGDVYEGEYVAGKLHGKGKYTSVKGFVHEGEFKDDEFVG